jgi:hypothetical protein
VVVEIATCGGDDTSYQVPLSVDVTFDGRTFNSVYATTNSVITFGAPDGTYWDYPQTPSISLYSFDWVVYPGARADEHLIIRSSDGGFQVDISARPIWLQDPSVVPTNIAITAAILSDGTVAMAYTLTGPEYPDANPRTGVRLNDGTVVDFETYGIQETEDVPDLGSEPTDEVPFTPVNSDTTTRTEDTERETTEDTDRESTEDTDRESTEDTDRESTEDTDRTSPFIPEGATVTNEGSFVEVVAPEGQRIANAVGYYGDPNDITRGGEVSSILFELLAGETSATVEVSNETFLNDPAPGTPKVLILLITYEEIPVASGPTPSPEQPTTPEPEPLPQEPVVVIPPEEEPVIEPSPEPTPVSLEEEPALEPEISEEPVEESTENEPEPLPEPEPSSPSEELGELAEVAPEDLTVEEAEKLFELAIAVFETAEVGSEEYQEALEALMIVAESNDPELPSELAAIPLLGDVAGAVLDVFNDLGNVGSDMSPEVRETAEDIVVVSVVVAQVVGVSTISAMSSTSIRRP